MLFVNVSAGIMIISQASPMAQQLGGLTPIAAAGVVGVIAIFNGLGRVFWAAVSDYIGRARVFTVLFTLQMLVFLLCPICTRCCSSRLPSPWSGFPTAAVSEPCPH